MLIRRLTVWVLLFSFVSPSLALAVDNKKAAYFGGTAAVFAGAKDPIEGQLDTMNASELVLTAEDKPFVGKTLRIPYDKIVDVEYGQKAGRRVGTAVATTVLLGPIGCCPSSPRSASIT